MFKFITAQTFKIEFQYTVSALKDLKADLVKAQTEHKRKGERNSDWQKIFAHRAWKIITVQRMQEALNGRVSISSLQLNEESANKILTQMEATLNAYFCEYLFKAQITFTGEIWTPFITEEKRQELLESMSKKKITYPSHVELKTFSVSNSAV